MIALFMGCYRLFVQILSRKVMTGDILVGLLISGILLLFFDAFNACTLRCFAIHYF